MNREEQAGEDQTPQLAAIEALKLLSSRPADEQAERQRCDARTACRDQKGWGFGQPSEDRPGRHCRDRDSENRETRWRGATQGFALGTLLLDFFDFVFRFFGGLFGGLLEGRLAFFEAAL